MTAFCFARVANSLPPNYIPASSLLGQYPRGWRALNVRGSSWGK